MSLPQCEEKAVIGRIRQLRRQYAGERGKASFAKSLGISPSTYNYYEHDRMPPATVLWDICRLTGADVGWLLSGQGTGEPDVGAEGSGGGAPGDPLVRKIMRLLQDEPKSGPALDAFVDLLRARSGLEEGRDGRGVGARGVPGQGGGAVQPWLPVLGRTSAGIVHFWTSADAPLPGMTDLADLIGGHQGSPRRQSRPSEISGDWLAAGTAAPDVAEVTLVQLSAAEPSGVCEFIESGEIHQRYPDAFCLRVDGESMAPRINDGDILVVSPSAPARSGTAAVVQLRDQIGDTPRRLVEADLIPCL